MDSDSGASFLVYMCLLIQHKPRYTLQSKIRDHQVFAFMCTRLLSFLFWRPLLPNQGEVELCHEILDSDLEFVYLCVCVYKAFRVFCPILYAVIQLYKSHIQQMFDDIYIVI